MNNDKDFLRDLFLKYGYDKSDVINKMMIDEGERGERTPYRKRNTRNSLFQKVWMEGFSFIKDCYSIC